VSTAVKILSWPEARSPKPEAAFALTPPMPPKPRKPPRRRKPPVSLKDEQMLALLQIVHAKSRRDYTLILMIYWHGLRASEAVNLRESDIDLANGKLKIHRGKGSDGGLHDLQTWGENPLFDERLAITEWLANREQFGVKGGAKPDPAAGARAREKRAQKMQQSRENVAFLPNMTNLSYSEVQKPAGGSEPLPPPSDDASELPIERLTLLNVESDRDPRLFPLHRSHVWKLVHGYMLEAGIPKYKCKTHTLKHTIAKHLVRAGVPVNEIMEWMGWRSMETMMWYIRADEEELGQRIGDAIRGKMGLRQMRQGNLFP